MCEMMKIMQENREVTCCLGSSANFRNSRLFLQSDLSIGLDPLYPSQCSWETFGYATGGGFNGDAEGLSPLRLAGQLNSLGCSVSFHQGNSVSLIKLIEQARHTTSSIRKCFLFLLQCQLCLVILQFLACLAQLPPPMNTTDILWMSCFSYPLLSVSLLGKPPDTLVMTVATGKNLDSIPKKTQNYFLGCFLLKFGLTVCAYLLVFGFTLQSVCPAGTNMTLSNNTIITCSSILTPSSSPVALHWFSELSNGLLLTQKLMAGFLVLHTVVISLSYVHRSQPLFRKSPFNNTWWCLTVPVVLVGHGVQAMVDYQLWRDQSSRLTFSLANIPLEVWLLASLSPLLVVVVNEVVKLHEIRELLAYAAIRSDDVTGNHPILPFPVSRNGFKYSYSYSSSSDSSKTGSRGQQTQQRHPNVPLPRHLFQLLRGEPKAFPGQPRDIESPVPPHPKGALVD
ncbi:Transmembrane protein 94 [Ataeniobius toweri]|uniref:Transmembrane protein 94 n=1 Tax=Ataeniobius toweri TaxID=208326 RepID=A0ABU7AFB0_9TELE|nr:Transmembrane protein 94 [Ataeniobius toweri]